MTGQVTSRPGAVAAAPGASGSVVVCALGGTAQCQPGDDGAVMPTLDTRTLLDRGQVVPPGARVSVIPMEQLPSAALDLADLIRMLARVVPLVESDGACGVVVSMGTDMLEEAAFALDLLWRHDVPLVVTAALRHPGQAGADGPANLRAALQVAVDPAARGLGCLVVLNDRVHAAWQVRKAHSSAPDAFRSVHSGPLGFVAEDRVRIVATPLDRPTIQVPASVGLPAVALLRASMGDDARAVSGPLEQGYQGIVIEAAGGGSVPPSWASPLGAAAARVPVVYASRTGAGATLQETYGGPGSERDLRARGVHSAGMLDGLKARVLLRLLLAARADDSRIRRCLDAFDRPTHRRRLGSLVASDPEPSNRRGNQHDL